MSHLLFHPSYNLNHANYSNVIKFISKYTRMLGNTSNYTLLWQLLGAGGRRPGEEFSAEKPRLKLKGILIPFFFVN